MSPILVTIILLGFASAAFAIVSNSGLINGGYRWASTGLKPDGTFKAKRSLLSAWEARAFHEFSTSLPDGLYLCPQVRIEDFITVSAPDPKTTWSARGQIKSRSIDFAVIETETGKVVLAIELNDKTHARADRRDRDTKVSDILRQAGIPLAIFHPHDTLDLTKHL